MVTRFTEYARMIVSQAEQEAVTDGSPLIEAEHLLLALASETGAEARRVLASAGLDRRALEVALDQERRQSLAAAGVTMPPGGLPRPSPHPARRPRMGASSRQVMQRALAAAAGQRRIRPGHLLLGVLGAQAGTVPRALAIAGADQGELAGRTREALA